MAQGRHGVGRRKDEEVPKNTQAKVFKFPVRWPSVAWRSVVHYASSNGQNQSLSDEGRGIENARGGGKLRRKLKSPKRKRVSLNPRWSCSQDQNRSVVRYLPGSRVRSSLSVGVVHTVRLISR